MTHQHFLSQPEGKTLEFKQDLSSPKGPLKTLVAFANTAGGRLVIGVTDDKNVIGVEKPLDEEERICNLIADAITPRLVPNVELFTVQNKTLLLVTVFLSGQRPHYLKSEGPESGVYVRLGSSNRRADAQLIAALQRGVAGISFDTLPMPDLSIDALDLPAIRSDFQERKINDSTLQSLKILVKDQGRLVPSQGGILLYGKDRREYFEDAWIQCARFIGHDKADIFDHIDIHDPLPKSVDSMMLFLKKHAIRGADFSETRRKDVWSVPINILREVVINALVHNDYSHQGTPIRIAFFDDRIEVENPGGLLPGLTVEDIKQGVSQIRNPLIARIFRELSLIEQWGSGIPGIFREAKATGLPEPDILEISSRIRVVVYLNEHHPIKGNQSRISKGPVKGPSQGAQSMGPVKGPSQKPLANIMLRVLSEKTLSAAELLNELGLKSKTGAFKRTLRELLDQKFIEYTLPEKPTSRLQKYRITVSGCDALAAKHKFAHKKEENK